MPAKTEREAFEDFVAYLRETLSCVTSNFLSAYQATDKTFRILFDPYPKIETKDGSPLYISVVQLVGTAPHAENPDHYKAKTRLYSYRLLRDPEDETKEVLGYHWHPDDSAVRYPHLHVRSVPRVHFPTSRVCLEDFIRLLIKYYGAKPRYARSVVWKILEKNKSAFEKYATWKVWF